MNEFASKLRNPSRAWLPAALLALALGSVAAVAPGKAQAADVQVRVLVDVADLIFRSGRPYYHDRGYYHPVVVEYDHYRRPVYYRYAPPPPVVVYRPARYYYAPPPRHYSPPPRHYSQPKHYRASHGNRHDDWRRHDRGRGNGKHRGR